jgi:hypothetical protein
MTFTKEELELYDEYLNYLKNELNIVDIKWNHKVKWCVLIDDKPKEVVTYHQWKIMVQREEKLNELFS